LSDHITITTNGGGTAILQTTDNTTYHTPGHQLVNAAGTTSLGIFAEDAAHSSAHTGIQILTVRQDVAAALSGTDADYQPPISNSTGQLWVTVGAHATGIGKAEDAAHTTADVGACVLAVRRDAKAVGSGTDGDYSTLNVNASGDLRVDAGDNFIVRVAPTVTAGAYSIADVFGGKQTIAAAARISGGGGKIIGVSMFDEGANILASDIEVIFFDSDPSGSTIADNDALAIVDADGPKIVGSVILSNRRDTGDGGLLYERNLNIPYVCVGGTSLYAVAVQLDITAPDATDGITFTYHLERD
jgi:hypothetical protein